VRCARPSAARSPEPTEGADASIPSIESERAAIDRRLQFSGELKQEFRAAHLIRTRARDSSRRSSC
jgi:hypothetical protein